MRIFKPAAVFLAVFLAAALCSCSSDPVPDSGFLPEPERMKHDDRVPVTKFWKDPDVKMLSYDKIIIAPVKTDQQVARTKRESRNIRNMTGKDESDIAEFAEYMRDSFKKAVEKGPCRLKLVDEPGPGVLRLEMSIVKIVPSKPFANAGKTALSCTPIGACFIPVKYAAKAMSDNPSPGQSSLAVEGRLVDSVSGRSVAIFAQRSKQCVAVLNFEDFSAYGNLEQISDAWAAKFVEIANKRPLETGEKVEAESQLKFINF